MNKVSKQFRSLAVALSSRGFGYAVLERNSRLVDYGHKKIYTNKNVRCLAHVEKMIVRSQPDALILSDVKAKGTYRSPRIKELHRTIIKLAKKQKLKVVTISGAEQRRILVGSAAGTRHDMAEFLAKQFPDELASRLPTKRKAWKSEDSRMDIFDAVGIALVHQQRIK
jgi:hypothetical protein